MALIVTFYTAFVNKLVIGPTSIYALAKYE